MKRTIVWALSVGISFYVGVLYAGWYMVEVPDSALVKIITFVKGAKKVVEVFGS